MGMHAISSMVGIKSHVGVSVLFRRDVTMVSALAAALQTRPVPTCVIYSLPQAGTLRGIRHDGIASGEFLIYTMRDAVSGKRTVFHTWARAPLAFLAHGYPVCAADLFDLDQCRLPSVLRAAREPTYHRQQKQKLGQRFHTYAWTKGR